MKWPALKWPALIVACLLPLFLTACFHRAHHAPALALAPPIVQTPPPKTEPVPAVVPPPAVTIPPQPASSTATTTPPAPVTPKPPVRHRKPVNRNPQEASVAIPGVSAIGKLTSGDPVGYRLQTEDLIASTERGLNGITRPLGDSEQKTAEHIREFLKQAKAALASGDVDGAHTLAAKAKVLLSELTH